MFTKNKKKLEVKNTLLFVLIISVIFVAIIFSLFLFLDINNGSNIKTSDYVKTTEVEQLLKNSSPIDFEPNNMSQDRPPATAGVFAGKINIKKNVLVTVEVYDDFECPFCLRHTNTVSKMLDEYGDRINIILKHFPLTDVHPNAQKAAEAYECAKEQGKKWEMHDKLFESQANKNMNVDTWKNDAVELGLDSAIFNECLDSGKYVEFIKADKEEGKEKGVRGTPATFVNDEIITGAAPYSALKSVIEKHLGR